MTYSVRRRIFLIFQTHVPDQANTNVGSIYQADQTFEVSTLALTSSENLTLHKERAEGGYIF